MVLGITKREITELMINLGEYVYVEKEDEAKFVEETQLYKIYAFLDRDNITEQLSYWKEFTLSMYITSEYLDDSYLAEIAKLHPRLITDVTEGMVKKLSEDEALKLVGECIGRDGMGLDLSTESSVYLLKLMEIVNKEFPEITERILELDAWWVTSRVLPFYIGGKDIDVVALSAIISSTSRKAKRVVWKRLAKLAKSKGLSELSLVAINKLMGVGVIREEELDDVTAMKLGYYSQSTMKMLALAC